MMMLKRIDLHKTPMTLEQVLEQLSAGDEIMLLRDDAPLAHIKPPVSETVGQVSDAPEGSLAHFFEVIDKTGGVPMDTQIDPEKIDDILNEEFADYIISQMNRGADE